MEGKGAGVLAHHLHMSEVGWGLDSQCLCLGVGIVIGRVAQGVSIVEA